MEGMLYGIVTIENACPAIEKHVASAEVAIKRDIYFRI